MDVQMKVANSFLKVLLCFSFLLSASNFGLTFMLKTIPILSYTKKLSTSLSGPYHSTLCATVSPTDTFTSPSTCAQLSIEEVAAQWKLVQFGRGSKAYYGLEVSGKEYYSSMKQITMSTNGGLGLELVEAIDSGNSRGGLVLIGGIKENSNAYNAGKFVVGDALYEISSEINGNEITTSLEACSYERTLDILQNMIGDSTSGSIKLTIKRLQRRKEVNTILVDPSGNPICNVTALAGYGTNLRTLLQNFDVALYDERTARFDSPYQTGNCGGEGACGTCLVSILSGQELINEKGRVEEKALIKQAVPPNYRWACRLKVAMDPAKGGTLKIKLRPQTYLWDWNKK